MRTTLGRNHPDYTPHNDRPWSEWSDAPPPRHASGCVEGEYVEDGRVRSAPIVQYHYCDERGSLWGYPTGSIREGSWKVHHPTFHRWRYVGPRVPTKTQQGNTILVWRFHEAPGELRALSEHGGDEDWLALLPNDDIPYWMECGTAFGSAGITSQQLPDDDRVLVIGAHA